MQSGESPIQFHALMTQLFSTRSVKTRFGSLTSRLGIPPRRQPILNPTSLLGSQIDHLASPSTPTDTLRTIGRLLRIEQIFRVNFVDPAEIVRNSFCGKQLRPTSTRSNISPGIAP